MVFESDERLGQLSAASRKSFDIAGVSGRQCKCTPSGGERLVQHTSGFGVVTSRGRQLGQLRRASRPVLPK